MKIHTALDGLLLEKVEGLRIPFEAPDAALDWKDWYHYVLFDPDKGIRILFNCCLAGRPGKGEILLTLLVTQTHNSPIADIQPGLYGNTVYVPWYKDMVSRYPIVISAPKFRFVLKEGTIQLQFEEISSQLRFQFEGKARSKPMIITENTSFGTGFIGWSLVPKLVGKGKLSIGKNSIDISEKWWCYHDHNFGRFLWGGNIGWEWLVAFLTDDEGVEYQLVFDRKTNRDHSITGFQYVYLYRDCRLRKVFLGETLSIEWERKSKAQRPLRLPGIMASLYAHQLSVPVSSISLFAQDEQDKMEVRFSIDASLELIVPDNQVRQHSIMEEISGSASLELTGEKHQWSAKGMFYAEYVR